jgi:adenylate cyclase class 2
MGRSTQEIEIKLAFETVEKARAAVENTGATISLPRHFEDNLVFDRPDRSLKENGMVLRLRARDNKRILTLKSPVPGVHLHKVREEHETDVGDIDVMQEVFTRLGFEIAWRYQKHRTQYSLGDLAICLDETPIGCYVELEGPPDQIDRTAAEMGFGIDDYMLHSYRELYVLEAHRRGIPEGDLLVGKTSDAPGQ